MSCSEKHVAVWSRGGSPDWVTFQLVQEAAPGLEAANSPPGRRGLFRALEETRQLPVGSGTFFVLNDPCPSTTLILSSKTYWMSCSRKEIVQSLEMDEAGLRPDVAIYNYKTSGTLRNFSKLSFPRRRQQYPLKRVF